MSKQHLELSAQCDCGAVTLHLAGQVVSMFQCSCSNCQKVSGSAHLSVVLMPAEAVRTVGATKTYSRPADSGASFMRHFCPDCGTTVWAQSSRAPALRIVPAGMLAGQNHWFAPNQLIFSRTHPDWDLVEQQMPHYQTYRPESPA